MIKCKIFSDWSDGSLERDINYWLEENPNIEIISINQSKRRDEYIVISIFYKKDRKLTQTEIDYMLD